MISLGDKSLNCLISLKELMDEIEIGQIVSFMERLNMQVLLCGRPDPEFLPEEIEKMVLELIEDVREFAEILHFDHALIAQINHLAFELAYRLGKNHGVSVSALLSSLSSTFSMTLANRKFLYMHAEKAKFYMNSDFFGERVVQSFPEAYNDILDAVTSYSVRLNTASVFHSMRVAEFGLQRVAKSLGIDSIGKNKPIPVEYAVWYDVITAIKNKREEISRELKGDEHSKKVRFYASCEDSCSVLKDRYRNDVMHAHQSYSEDEALAALKRVAEFMSLIVNLDSY